MAVLRKNSIRKVCGSPKFKTAVRIEPFMSVDEFVAAKALSFNKIQSTSTGRLQRTQQESLRNNKNP
jgi:hypothetical protein